MGRAVLNLPQSRVYNHGMRRIIVRCALVAIALMVATSADAERHHRRARQEVEREPPVSVDKRDSIVNAAGPFDGRPYWLALAQCGGIYFKLNTLYTDAAVHARVIKPDPHANAEFTKKLNQAINIATTYFSAAENFLRSDRDLERDNAILTYDGQSRAAGDRVTTIDAGLAAAKACPALYQACQTAYPKACSAMLRPMG
jgi:hypothetical protein